MFSLRAYQKVFSSKWRENWEEKTHEMSFQKYPWNSLPSLQRVASFFFFFFIDFFFPLLTCVDFLLSFIIFYILLFLFIFLVLICLFSY